MATVSQRYGYQDEAAAQPDDAAPQASSDPGDAQAYASRYQLPLLAAHEQTAAANLDIARSNAVAATGGFIAASPPAPPLPPGIVHDAPQTQAWRNSAAAAADPAAAVFTPKSGRPVSRQAVPLAGGGRPRPR